MVKRVLVTGGAGYIGATTAHYLRRAGYEPIVLDNLARGHRQFIGDLPFIHADITDPHTLHLNLVGKGIDAVIHFAGLIEVGESVKDPLAFYRTNIGGTTNLLAAMRSADIGRIVFSSTAAVYGVPEKVPISESQPLAPINPYGATKVAVEGLLSDCQKSYGLQWIALRYFNAAGADTGLPCGEWHNPETHLIPNALLAAAGKRDQLDLYGVDYPTEDGTAVRDYIHVSDLAAAHIAALQHLSKRAGNAYNLGVGKGFSVRQVIKASAEVTGRRIPVEERPRRPGDSAALVADPQKAQAELDWHPKQTRIEDIVASAWQWYGEHGFNPSLS